MKKVHITVGLPGAGKSEWGKEKSKNSRNVNIRHVEFDSCTLTSWDKRTQAEKFYETIRNSYNCEELVIDSFITNNDTLIKLISELHLYVCPIVIHYWEPDIEKCLWNDLGRRDKDSIISIENSIIEIPDVDIILRGIKENRNPIHITMEKHMTQTKPAWKVFYDKHVREHATLNENNRITSQSWSMGGDWKDCWGGGGSVSGEAPPETFEAFDNILEEICPEISFLKYRKIWGQCIETDDYRDHDYYGGSTSNGFYSLNVERLYNILVEMKLIEEYGF
jgi:hypothetical protein